MNWIMDKHALVQAWGGPTIGDVANHIVPDSLLNNQLADYAPYKTPGDHGSVAKAKAAMKGSKYDTEQERHVQRQGVQERAPDRRHPRGRHEDAAGDRSQTRRRSASPSRSARSTVRTRRSRPPSKNVPIAERPGWGKDYADAVHVLQPAVRRPHDHPDRQHELLARRDHAGAWRRRSASRATCDNVPSVERGPRQRARTSSAPRTPPATRTLDKKLMTQVVPWVPYLWSKVTRITSKNVTQVRVRPVRNDARLRTHGGQVGRRSESHGFRGAPQGAPEPFPGGTRC